LDAESRCEAISQQAVLDSTRLETELQRAKKSLLDSRKEVQELAKQVDAALEGVGGVQDGNRELRIKNSALLKEVDVLKVERERSEREADRLRPLEAVIETSKCILQQIGGEELSRLGPDDDDEEDGVHELVEVSLAALATLDERGETTTTLSTQLRKVEKMRRSEEAMARELIDMVESLMESLDEEEGSCSAKLSSSLSDGGGMSALEMAIKRLLPIVGELQETKKKEEGGVPTREAFDLLRTLLDIPGLGTHTRVCLMGAAANLETGATGAVRDCTASLQAAMGQTLRIRNKRISQSQERAKNHQKSHRGKEEEEAALDNGVEWGEGTEGVREEMREEGSHVREEVCVEQDEDGSVDLFVVAQKAGESTKEIPEGTPDHTCTTPEVSIQEEELKEEEEDKEKDEEEKEEDEEEKEEEVKEKKEEEEEELAARAKEKEEVTSAYLRSRRDEKRSSCGEQPLEEGVAKVTPRRRVRSHSPVVKHAMSRDYSPWRERRANRKAQDVEEEKVESQGMIKAGTSLGVLSAAGFNRVEKKVLNDSGNRILSPQIETAVKKDCNTSPVGSPQPIETSRITGQVSNALRDSRIRKLTQSVWWENDQDAENNVMDVAN